MRKTTLLCLLLAAVCACQKTPVPEPASADADLSGTQVDLSTVQGLNARKIFVLNEGQMGANDASLDFLRVSNATYITGAFKKMNPTTPGLGDVGNDIAVRGDEVWMVINNSGLVEVVSALDEKEVGGVGVPTPRSIAFDDRYAYVTSWAGAYVNGVYDEHGQYTLADYVNPKGQVYRINLSTKKLEGSVEVGHQPEGIALSQGKLYVANSGGISSQLPPLFQYDNTVSVIDIASFQVVKTIEVQINLKNVYADGQGNVYVTSLGNYFDVHSGLYMIDSGDTVTHVADYVSVSAQNGDTVYCVGASEEFDWINPTRNWVAFSCTRGQKKALSLNVEASTPYSLCALGGDNFLLGDAGDYVNPGTVSLYSGSNKKWSVTAGVCPGHFAIW